MQKLNTKPTRILLPESEPLLEKPEKGKIISVCEPLLNGNESKYLVKCVRSNWISSKGDFIERFESAFKKIFNTRYAVTCSSGTAALHLALAALDIKEGDEVIIPTFTMIATANAITYLGGKPVLVDSDPVTWNIDPGKIEGMINKHTKAIIPVHTYGLPADMDEVVRIAKKYNLYVIEDAAEAHGAEYKQKMAGSIGDIGCFSFYGNKIITTGEGGMVITNTEKIAKKVKILRDHAFSKERHFWHKYLGYNYRMTNMQAAIGLAQIERFKELVETRIKNSEYYSFLLRDIKGISLPPEVKGVKNVHWMYSILIEDNFGLTRDNLRKYLAKKGIETRTFFIPIHLQPIYHKKYKSKFLIAEELCRKGMYLPSGPTLGVREIKYIAKCIRSAQDKRRKL